ncbi:MAG TPA: DUF3157 family protein [Bacillota bacterium]|nr:DUF3157 family protein [Bacillota bacterium]
MKTQRYFVWLLIMGTILSSYCFAQEVVTNQNGQKILIKDDHTWEYLNEANKQTSTEPAGAPPAAVNARYAEEAIEVWDTQLLERKVNYSDAVVLYLHYLNRTNKKVVGIVVNVVISNPFGKTVFEHTYEDEVVVQPLERLRNDTYWYFTDNQFIRDEPYDRMWQMAENGTAKVKTQIQKVIFEDGTVLKNKPAVSSKPVKK